MKKTTWLVIAGLLAVTAAWALDPPQPAPQAAEAEETKPADASGPEATAPVEGQETAAPEEETLPPLSPEVRSTGPTPQRFDPSEEVRADFPVSFPIDI